MGAGLLMWRSLSWLIGWIFWWQLVASLALVLQTLIHRGLTVIMSACNISFVDLLLVLADVFCGMHLMREFMQRLWLLIFATLCSRTMLMLWHAFVFLGLRPVGFSPPFSFLLGGFHCLFL
jgi:hypothetical protein